jgi:hypothetical protein
MKQACFYKRISDQIYLVIQDYQILCLLRILKSANPYLKCVLVS